MLRKNFSGSLKWKCKMIHIEEYIQQSNLSRRTIERYIQAGELLSIKLNGKTFILKDDQLAGLKAKSRKQIISSVKDQLNVMLTEAHNNPALKSETIKNIEKVILSWSLHNIIIKGYDKKSCYRKINDLGKIERKTRSDKFSIRNEVLSANMPKLRPLAAYIYKKNAQGNLSIICDLIKFHAKNDEEYYEFANVPKATLYRQLTLDFKQSGFKSVHQYFNHHNLWAKTLPTVTGAFTDDINFFDYIAGDDHKADVASVYVYDEASGKTILKQVKIWLWVEVRTMMPLGWIIKTGDINSRDLELSLAEVFLRWGLPKKQILIDNGIGRSAEFQAFVNKIYAGMREGRGKIHYSAAYTPTNKATMERSFGLIKNELDVFQKNFVGPNKETESRHSTKALSPESADLFIEDYKRKLEQYLTGFFIERERLRVINGDKTRISIKSYFDNLYKSYEPSPIAAKDIRYALSQTDEKVYRGSIKFKGSEYLPIESLPLSFHGQRFRILYYPNDLSEIDIYALDDMLDRQTGLLIQKNNFIATFISTRTREDRREAVLKARKHLEKDIKELSEDYTSLMSLEGKLFESSMPDMVANNGKILEQRETTKKAAKIAIKTSLQKLPGQNLTIENRPAADLQETSLTIEDSDDNDSLTFEE